MNAPLLRFGVVSDIHSTLADDGMSLVPGKGVESFEKSLAFFRDNGADAVVVAGDLTDTGLAREFRAVADAWFRIFPGDRAPDGRKVERVFVTGNHDACGLYLGPRVFQDKAALRREVFETDPQGVWRDCFGEEYRPCFRKTVKGFDFFCSQWTPGIWCNGYAETGCSHGIAAFRGQMAACDPARPFFYVQHAHPAGTVYGMNAWGRDDGSVMRLLADFPQAVAFSGHSHEPLTNEKSLWLGPFASVATGSLQYISASFIWNFEHRAGYENGICCYYGPGISREDRGPLRAEYDAPKTMPNQTADFDVKSGLFATVFADRIEIARIDFASGLELGTPWTVPVPSRPQSFETRAESALPPSFPSGVVLKVSETAAATRGLAWHAWNIAPVKKPALRLDFPAATEGGRTVEYEIAVEGDAAGRFATRICAVGGLYPPTHPKAAGPVCAILARDRFPAGAKTVSVVPLDSFGNRGRPLEARVPS